MHWNCTKVTIRLEIVKFTSVKNLLHVRPHCEETLTKVPNWIWNKEELTLMKSHLSALIVTSSSKGVVIWVCIVEFTPARNRLSVPSVTRNSKKDGIRTCIVEFTLAKSRSHVQTVSRSSDRFANWMYIVEFTPVRNRLPVRTVAKSSQKKANWKYIVEFTQVYCLCSVQSVYFRLYLFAHPSLIHFWYGKIESNYDEKLL